jgi:uncharacterized protein (TIGR02646 family)
MRRNDGMRRLIRVGLPGACQTYLARKQKEVDSGKPVDPLWKKCRKTKSMKRVVEVLTTMTGVRCRCMYCEDSRGTTIEHFQPKSTYPEKTFIWINLLLLCQGCQSHKGNSFSLDANGDALLINPTAEDPWDFLFFDSQTGIITGRFPTASTRPHPKGEHTTLPKTLPLNIEAVTEGRLRTTRNLRRAVRSFLERSPANQSSLEDECELLEAVQDNDNYGLAVWFFLRDGRIESPFRELESNHGMIWQAIIKQVG